MDSSQQALQTNGNLLLNSNFFQISGRKPKKYSNEYRGMNIYQSAMCYVSIDSFRQALQI